MSVMNEQLQRLTLPACRSNVSLQALALDGTGTVRSELPVSVRFGPDTGAARQAIASSGDLRKGISRSGGIEPSLHRITRQMPAKALGPHRCKELTPKTTESHRSGGQREP